MDISFANAVGLPERAIVSVCTGGQRRQQSYKDNCCLKFDASNNEKKRIVVDVFERVGSKKIWLADLAGEGSELSDRIVVPRMYGDSKSPVHLDMKVRVHGTDGKRPSSAAKRHETTIKASSYLDQHGVQNILTSMMQVVLLEKPQDPVAFMSKYLADYAKISLAERQFANPGPPPPLPSKSEKGVARQGLSDNQLEPFTKSCDLDFGISEVAQIASLPTIAEQTSDALTDTYEKDMSQTQEAESLRADLRQALGKALEADQLLNLLQHALGDTALSSSSQSWLDEQKCSLAES
jgi:hypothetical protein